MLQKYLKINSLFSGFSGLIMILFSEQLSILFNIKIAFVFPFIGVNLLIFSALVYVVATKFIDKSILVKAITYLDVLWVIGSIFIVIFQLFNLSLIGYIITSFIAAWIGFLAYSQWKYRSNLYLKH